MQGTEPLTSYPQGARSRGSLGRRSCFAESRGGIKLTDVLFLVHLIVSSLHGSRGSRGRQLLHIRRVDRHRVPDRGSLR